MKSLYSNTTKMISALISAAVALLIFTWTQWIVGLRSQHDLLRSKMEELCRLVVGLKSKVLKAERSLALPGDVEVQKGVISQLRQSIVDDSLTMQMLGILYFPLLKTHVHNLITSAEKTVGHREFYGDGGHAQPTEYKILINSKIAKLLSNQTSDFFNFVSLEYMQLTKAPQSRMAAMVEKVLS